MLVLWWHLIQFGRQGIEDHNPVEKIMCDITVFCKYIEKFVSRMKNTNPDWTQIGYKLQILIEILRELEVDEYGKKSLCDFIENILFDGTKLLNENTISSLVKCAEKCIRSDLLGRYLGHILNGICDDVPSVDQKIDEFIGFVQDDEIKVRIAQIKCQILEMKEKEKSCLDADEHVQLHQVQHEIKELRIRIIDICRDYGTGYDEEIFDISDCEMSTEAIIKCLQIFFYGCHSFKTDVPPPEMTLFYQNFVHGK